MPTVTWMEGIFWSGNAGLGTSIKIDDLADWQANYGESLGSIRPSLSS